MKRVWEIVSNKNFWPLFVVIVFAILAGRSLIFESGYFNMHDDLQMMRQLQMEKCFQDGQIPCRWVPDMGYGFGFPLFNFYPPLPYLIGQGIRLLGFSFVTTVKITFALSFIVSGITMYLLAKEFFGRIGGALSSVFYIWAPYQAVDVYVRGAMNEVWAIAWFPLIFWVGYKLIAGKDKRKRHPKLVSRAITSRILNLVRNSSFKWVVLLALSYAALLTSHNLMVLIFTPFLGLWVLLHLWRENAWSRLPQLIISAIWALGLAAFFTLPALVENQLTHIREQLGGYYEYTAHFVNIKQLLISRFWGYGGSAWGIVNDKMSFQIGHLHWILSLVVGLFLAIRIIGVILQRRKISKDRLLLVSGLILATGWFAAFMTHSRSIYIYQTIPFFGFIQFPWRFLAIVIFSFSFIAGAIPGIIAEWKSQHKLFVRLFATAPQLIISFFLIVLLLILNWSFFRPEGGRMGILTDEQKFTGLAWELQQKGGVIDYLPQTAKVVPDGPRQKLAEVITGRGTISETEEGTNWVKFKVDIDSEETVVRINIFDFPKWKVFVDNSEIEKFIPEEEMLGRIWIKVPPGNHQIYAQFFNTPIRTAANLISLFSWAILVWFLFSYRRKTS